ncbi:MAG TPA: hypothetical protein VMY99_02125 [Nevskiaceae bacterium]|nr:hypothetical protein [Nevskiaceae bacterium]
MTYYIGNFKQDSAHHQGWFVGEFIEQKPRQTRLFEIKYWHFAVGPTKRRNKTSTATECTLLLKGHVQGSINGQPIELHAGEYAVIPPGMVNNLEEKVLQAAEGLTIKAPSNVHNKTIVP